MGVNYQQLLKQKLKKHPSTVLTKPTKAAKTPQFFSKSARQGTDKTDKSTSGSFVSRVAGAFQKNAADKITEAAQSLHINPDDTLQFYRDDLDVIADMPTDTVKAYLQDALDNGKLTRTPKAPVIPVDEYILTAALRVLQQLYQQHRERLVAGGYSPDGARVKMLTWRAQCNRHGITESRFADALDELVKRGKVMIRHGYAYRAGHE